MRVAWVLLYRLRRRRRHRPIGIPMRRHIRTLLRGVLGVPVVHNPLCFLFACRRVVPFPRPEPGFLPTLAALGLARRAMRAGDGWKCEGKECCSPLCPGVGAVVWVYSAAAERIALGMLVS